MEGTTAKERAEELTAVLIAPQRELARQFHASLSVTHAFRILADLKEYPAAQTLGIRLRQLRPKAVLLDLATDSETACSLIHYLASQNPPIVAVGLDLTTRPEVVMRALRLGASEFLTAPFEPAEQRDAAEGILRLRKQLPAGAEPGRIIAFASAKPGSGASVLACQTAFSLAQLTHSRVLLADLDVAGGTVGFYTRLEHDRSFLDALEQAGEADSAAWNSLSAHWRGVDVLPAPPDPRELPADPVRLRQSLDRLRRSYDWVILDLPSIFNRISMLALAEADSTFLITTTELPSLHLARKAVKMLARAGVEPDRFEMVVNQAGRRAGMGSSDLEKVLSHSVRAMLPDDQAALHEATALGGVLKPEGALGAAVGQLAGRLAGVFAPDRRAPGLAMEQDPAFAGM